MWDDMFDTGMLVSGAEIAINCPEHELERELAAILTAFGMTFPGGISLLENKGKQDFCYYVMRDGFVRYGPKSSTKRRPYDSFKKCTFYGDESCQDEISDDSFIDIIRK